MLDAAAPTCYDMSVKAAYKRKGNGVMTQTDRLMADQSARYPGLEAQDLVKVLYQSEFGCGHFAPDGAEALSRLLTEMEASQDKKREKEPELVEPLGPAFCRVHLSRVRENGLKAETLCRLFMLSAEEKTGDKQTFLNELTRIEALCKGGALPVSYQAARAFLAAYRAAGCPATHHSEAFRARYAPCYRVIAAPLCRFLPLFSLIDGKLSGKDRVLIAIEGRSASGKSTLAQTLHRVYDANVFHMDDFFLRPNQRTAERLAQPGGNVDYERFLREVLAPLRGGEAFLYRPYSCAQQALLAPVPVSPKRLNIVEGAYSMHPFFGTPYDAAVFLSVSKERQAKRILERNGASMQRRFLSEWIPLEEKYFAACHARERCDLKF